MNNSHTQSEESKTIKRMVYNLFVKCNKRFPVKSKKTGFVLDWSKIYQPNVDMALAWTADLDTFPIEIVEVAIQQAREEYPTELPPLGKVLIYSKKILKKREQVIKARENSQKELEIEVEKKEKPNGIVDWQKLADEGNAFAKAHVIHIASRK